MWLVCCVIFYDGVFDYFFKGGKVVVEGLVGGFLVEIVDEYFFKI